jgi:anti-anti-sigma factor
MTTSPPECVIVLEGEWDLARRDELTALADQALADCESSAPILVDLRPTTFIDSSALSVLVSLYARARGEGRRLVTLCGDEGPARRTIDLLGIGERLGLIGGDAGDESNAVA